METLQDPNLPFYIGNSSYSEKQRIPHFVPLWGYVMTRSPQLLEEIAKEYKGNLKKSGDGYSLVYQERTKLNHLTWDNKGRLTTDLVENIKEDGKPENSTTYMYDDENRVIKYITYGFNSRGRKYVVNQVEVSYNGPATSERVQVEGFNYTQQVPFEETFWNSPQNPDHLFRK